MSPSTELPIYTLKTGHVPVLISIPHMGTRIPDDIARTMTPVAQRYDDTDWHLDRLYGFAQELGASVLIPTYSRYVIDLNRPPDGSNLYPGQKTTLLCPLDTFADEALYPNGHEPSEAEQKRRIETYWRPYHDALRQELERLRAQHGCALLWEAHSIRAYVPRLFEGRLPDFNFGTADGASAMPGLCEDLAALVTRHGGYSTVANGRFKGGHITRHYGDPSRGIHAVQLELTQVSYMEEVPPHAYDEAKAAKVAPLIRSTVELALERVRGTV